MRDISKPQPGFYKIRLVKGGPWVAALIFVPCPIDPHHGHYIDRSRHLLGRIGDGEASHDAVDRIWVSGRAIAENKYRHMLTVAAWDRINQPDSPTVAPRQAIDMRRLALPF